MEWSPEIAAHAQEWADFLAANNKFEHRKEGKKYGENIAGGQTLNEGVTLWINEKSLYKGGVLTTDNWYPSGHYTQMVWENTKKIGMGKAFSKEQGYWIFVCNYDPPGNFLTERPFKAGNVPGKPAP